MRRLAIPLILVLLGAAAACGFAPLQAWWLAVPALAAFLWLVHDAPNVKAALWRGWWFGFGHFTINNNWIQHAFTYQDNMPHWLGYGAPIALALYLAVFPAAAAGLAWRLASPRATGDAVTPPGAAFVLVAGAGWIVTEWLRAELFTGYAWDPIGVIWVAILPVARASAWVGTYALSGLTIVAAGALMLLVGRRWVLTAVVAAATTIIVTVNFHNTAPARPNAPLVRVVQPNLGLEDQDAPDYTETSFEALLGLSGHPGARPRLIVWPEGAVRYMLEDGYPLQYYYEGWPSFTRARIAAKLGPRDILLTGGDGLLFDKAGHLTYGTNSIFAIDAYARILGRYDKAHLVPYGEYLPMPWLLRPLGLSRLVPGDTDFKPGPGPRDFTLPGFGKIGGQVCYEIVFSGEVVDEKHRPALIFNPSNDAWFGSWGPPQHLAQARMRAIEEGVPILRSTPTGISAVIAADGRLLGALPLHHAGAIQLPMPGALPPTPFSLLGNWWAAIVAAALCLVAVVIRRRAR
ncbi:apolipoprotein N-acyltransferase [Hephaestia mangrovi]|uniref:apolipoprotein N-acyltransferase n=1 Tax=Hephaestia mangrovi TaxID=2873268 RepID=UPI001CA6CD06|nr:apolipoprotein N-acyltransferase [Hephaestia mangrovi]MBY8829214.1 apolipoprotein N-acyltransferase [Hephaestia mangrovi]